MSFLDGWEKIEEYALAHTEPPTDVLARLAAETRETMERPQMMVGALEGRFLEFLVRLARPQLVSVLEQLLRIGQRIDPEVGNQDPVRHIAKL